MIEQSPLDFFRRNRRGAALAVVFILAACLALLLLAGGLLWARQQRLPEGVAVDPDTNGLLVTHVVPASPAALAGLTRGTIIFAVDGLAIDDRAMLEAVLADRPGIAEVTLLILRSDQPEFLTLTLAAAPPRLGVAVLGSDETAAAPPEAADPALPVVTRVIVGSPAEAAGFARGDIIVAVDDRPVGSTSALLQALAVLQPGDVVPFTVQRAGLEERLLVTVGRREGDLDRPFVGIQLPASER